MSKSSKSAGWTLLPFVIFVVVFLGAGIYYDNFYIMPSPIAICIGIIAAFLMLKGKTKEKMTTFLKGCGDMNILTMCIIYLLAGAFATVSKSIGSTDAIVQIGVNYLSPAYYPVGIFLIAAFLSTSAGTSVGTVAALGPIALGLAEAGGCDINLIGAALLGGAMFGDNLSFISDTTIASTQIVGCEMRDKFKNNIQFVIPAAVIAALLYIYMGDSAVEVTREATPLTAQSFLLVIPYLSVIILAFIGIDVFAVLVIGIIISGIFGFWYNEFGFLEYAKTIYEGFTGMTEIFLLSLLTGGLAAMIEKAGGINSILQVLKKKMSGSKSALLGIGTFVGLTDAATANNTISIIITGKVAQKIMKDFHIKPQAMASILDTFSCVVQGLLPYGAQVLILTGLSQNTIDYPQLLQYSFYLFLLFIAVTTYIYIGNIKQEKIPFESKI